MFVIVNPEKSQSPAHGPGRTSCACVWRVWRVCGFFLLLVGSLSSSAFSAESTDNGKVGILHATAGAHGQKFRVNDPGLAREAIVNGAELVSDYGSFQLFRANGELARKLAANPSAEDRSKDDVVLLHAAHLNTTSAEAKALRKPVDLFLGKHLHLFQFVGPPKPEC